MTMRLLNMETLQIAGEENPNPNNKLSRVNKAWVNASTNTPRLLPSLCFDKNSKVTLV